MASPEKIAEWLPETLPEDFGEWDNNASAAAVPARSGGLEGGRALGEAPKPPGPAEREAILASVLDRPRGIRPGSPAPESFRPQKLSSSAVDKSPSRASHRLEGGDTEVIVTPRWQNSVPLDEVRNTPQVKATAINEADAALFQLFSSRSEVEEVERTAKKKWMIAAAVGFCAILFLLFGMMPHFRHGTKAVAKAPIQTASQSANPLPNTNTAKPLANEPLTREKAVANTKTQEKTVAASTADDEQVNSAGVQATMMNDQLTAPTQISKDIKNPVVEKAPPPLNFGAAGLSGSGADASVFSGQAQPVVKAAKPVAISAGVATGLLIQKTLPVYPPIARASRVSGTVVLEATITKEGAIKDVRVASGPAMLRQSAVDAVRRWRYKPYQLNNQPTEVETTINVIFSLGG
jgi:TonB family protein